MTKPIIFIFSVLLLGNCTQYKKIKLEKVIFHTSRCFGTCPAYHSEIDRNQNLLLYSEYVSKTPGIYTNLNNPDTSKMGYFVGKVSDNKYQELLNEIENIGLDNLKFDGLDCCDGSIKTIIVYYNGKGKFLKSMRPPREADRLISILRFIDESTKTQRTDKKFTIEGSNF